jgi:hypothetical protein
MEATQEAPSFTKAEEKNVAAFVEGETSQPFNDGQAAQVLKAIGASTSSVGKSLNSQVAASVQKIKPEAQDSAVRKLLRGMVTRADMEGAPGKKTLGIMTPQGVSEMRVFKCLWFLFCSSCLWCSSSRSSYNKKIQKKRYKQK